MSSNRESQSVQRAKSILRGQSAEIKEIKPLVLQLKAETSIRLCPETLAVRLPATRVRTRSATPNLVYPTTCVVHLQRSGPVSRK